MTGAFPPHDAALDASTFEQCYLLIAQAIHEETPDSVTDPFHRMPDYQKMVGEALAPLDKWRSHAFDGDPAELPHQTGTPWSDLDLARIGHLADLIARMSTIGQNLNDHWSGAGAEHYSAYMAGISERLNEYAGPGGYVQQVAAVLEDAFAVRVAFKKDLLELARGAYDKIKSIHDGPTPGDVGMLCLMLGSLAFGEIGVVGAGATVAGKIFSKAVTSLNDQAFATSKARVFIHGDLPKDIMKTFDTALDQVVEGHRNAAKQLITRMDTLWHQLCYSADEKYYPPIPVIDTSHTPSFSKQFFPR